jgi:hypothetical protein
MKICFKLTRSLRKTWQSVEPSRNDGDRTGHFVETGTVRIAWQTETQKVITLEADQSGLIWHIIKKPRKFSGPQRSWLSGV